MSLATTRRSLFGAIAAVFASRFAPKYQRQDVILLKDIRETERILDSFDQLQRDAVLRGWRYGQAEYDSRGEVVGRALDGHI